MTSAFLARWLNSFSLLFFNLLLFFLGGPDAALLPTVMGPVNSSKVSAVESLASIVGRQLHQTICTNSSQPASLLRMVSGLCLSGTWGVFSELSDLSVEALSVLVEHVRAVYIRSRTSKPAGLRSFGWNMPGSSQLNTEDSTAALAPDVPTVMDETMMDESTPTPTPEGWSLSAIPFAIFGTCTIGLSNPLPTEVRACFREIHVS